MGRPRIKKKTTAKKITNNATKKKTTTKREKTNLRGLDKQLFSRIKQEYHDLDYINKLSDKEKQWMSDFMGEWLGANLNDSEKKMHVSRKRRKQVYDMNNARNRDIMSNTRAGNVLDSYDGEIRSADEVDPSLAEDRFIDNIEVDQEMLDAAIEALKDKCKK